MKMISIQSDRFVDFPSRRSRLAPAAWSAAVPAGAGAKALVHGRSSEAPPRRMPQRLARPRSDAVLGLRLAAPAESFGEKLVMSIVAGAAVAAVADGLSWVLDLVENWAAFQQGIGRMLQ